MKVKVGKISALLREPPDNTGQVVCGHVVCDIGYASAYRFYTELDKIREALDAARAVLTERGSEGKTTAAEMHLASLLIELEVQPAEPSARADHERGLFKDDPYDGPDW